MKVLLATDGTEESDEAMDMLGALNHPNISQVRILTVIDMALPFAHDIYSGMVTNTAELEEAARKAAEEALKETVASARSLISDESTAIESKTAIGSPERQIVEEAEEFGADLIVMGSHGYNRWERLLLGSVSDSVVHHAPCSVLVVRKKESD
ncbi:MAG: universal stress protein [Pyrinomonadaceae bacterium]|nr:universal stress protein [Pyrinomonadaceae bacterium]